MNNQLLFGENRPFDSSASLSVFVCCARFMGCSVYLQSVVFRFRQSDWQQTHVSTVCLFDVWSVHLMVLASRGRCSPRVEQEGGQEHMIGRYLKRKNSVSFSLHQAYI